MASHRYGQHLAPSQYDSDAPSIQSASDQASDSEDDRVIRKSRNTRELKEHDRSILLEEAEREKLLSRTGALDGLRQAFVSTQVDGVAVKISKRDARRRRRAGRRRRHGTSGEERELMFEMEEGVKDLSSQSSTQSFDFDRKQWALDNKQTKKSFFGRLTFVLILIVALFLLLALGAYRASNSSPNPEHARPSTLSNGTHLFAPTTILISLDGFRADFLNRGLTPALNAFIASGVSPRYMLPSFPSVTFPNHFTLVTGLYPESHGVVGNTFWDPTLLEEFYYTDPDRSMDPKWWTAEPLWVTAEDQGVRTAIHMWPGSEAHIPDIEPTYLDKFNESESLVRKVDRVLSWLDLPGDQDNAPPSTIERRPQLIAAYVPNVDTDGHLYGPNSTEIRATIADVDSMLTLLTEGLYVRNLTEIINMVIVSDHGMATTSTSRMIQLDDLIDLSLVDHIDGWPLRGLRLKNPNRDVPIMYEQLLAQSKKSPGFDVYTLDTMPERYHFTQNDRIAPLWIVPKTAWAVVERADFDIAEALTVGKTFHPKGMHGYDHEHPLMRAIFVARGPAFPHEPNSMVPAFQNTEVYNIVCDSLGIKPHPNNGTLRLPLQTVGLHSDTDAPNLDTPPDPVSADEGEGPDRLAGLDDPGDSQPNSTTHNADKGDNEDEPHGSEGETTSGWWDYVHEELEKLKDWSHDLLESLKNDKHEDQDSKRRRSAG